MSTIPKISVIIPIYNAEKYLRQCLDSVINQSLRDIEIICVNDCSTDKSLNILEEYTSKDNRIKILNNSLNLKAGETRNRGIREAVGEYIHFFDADDYLAKDAYQTLYQKAHDFNLDLVKSKVFGIDATTTTNVFDTTYNLSNLAQSEFNKVTDFFTTPKLFIGVSVAPWNGLYKRSFLLENNLFFNQLSCVNDRSFCAAVILKAKAAMIVDKPILYHRVNLPTSLVGSRAKYFECHFESYKMIEKMCEQIPANLKFIILENELHDMFFWYRKYQREHVLEKEIYQKTKAFVESLDISPFGEKLTSCRWYRYFYKLRDPAAYAQKTRLRTRLFYKILDFSESHRTTFNLYRFLTVWEEEGFKTAVKKAVKYIFKK